MAASQETRTFHVQSSSHYSLPNDATEHHRLELQSQGLSEMMQTVFHAPISQPKHILEVGSGTGHVCRTLCSTYPDAEVIGLDLSPVPPQPEPCRATFIEADFMTTTDARLRPASFDYIFSRMLSYGIPDWHLYLSHVKNLLQPGAWVELQEADTTRIYDNAGTNLSEHWTWLKEQKAAFAKKGVDPGVGPKLADYLREAGFVNIQVLQFRWPFGTYEGHPETDLVARVMATYNGKVNAVSYRKLLGGTMSEELMRQREEEVTRAWAWDEEGSGKHCLFWVVWAQKP